MKTNKGFGPKPNIKIVPLHGFHPFDFDQCMKGYLNQGLSKAVAKEMISVSALYKTAEDEGLKPGVDVQFDSRNGIWISPEMQDVMKKAVPKNVWNHWELEGLVSEDADVMEVNGEQTFSTRAICKLLLYAIRNPEDTEDEGDTARANATVLLVKAGMSEFEAGQRLRQWIAGDDSLMGEMIALMDGSINDAANEHHQQQEDDRCES